MTHYPVNGVNLWIEEAGSGPALVFVHEFGGGYRCVAYNPPKKHRESS
jgi:hypothetical protein